MQSSRTSRISVATPTIDRRRIRRLVDGEVAPRATSIENVLPIKSRSVRARSRVTADSTRGLSGVRPFRSPHPKRRATASRAREDTLVHHDLAAGDALAGSSSSVGRRTRRCCDRTSAPRRHRKSRESGGRVADLDIGQSGRGSAWQHYAADSLVCSIRRPFRR